MAKTITTSPPGLLPGCYLANITVDVGPPRAAEGRVVTGVLINPGTGVVLVHWRYTTTAVPNVGAVRIEEFKHVMEATRMGRAPPPAQGDGAGYFGAVCGPDHVFLLLRDGPYLVPVPMPRQVLEAVASRISNDMGE